VWNEKQAEADGLRSITRSHPPSVPRALPGLQPGHGVPTSRGRGRGEPDPGWVCRGPTEKMEGLPQPPQTEYSLGGRETMCIGVPPTPKVAS
jgi:hypothetical protein